MHGERSTYIGAEIKRLRTQHGMTQKALGIALGFSERNADVRIAQYESGIRTPKKDVTDKIAAVLNVSPTIFDKWGEERRQRLLQTLDELEDLLVFAMEEITEIRKSLK